VAQRWGTDAANSPRGDLRVTEQRRRPDLQSDRRVNPLKPTLTLPLPARGQGCESARTHQARSRFRAQNRPSPAQRVLERLHDRSDPDVHPGMGQSVATGAQFRSQPHITCIWQHQLMATRGNSPRASLMETYPEPLPPHAVRVGDDWSLLRRSVGWSSRQACQALPRRCHRPRAGNDELPSRSQRTETGGRFGPGCQTPAVARREMRDRRTPVPSPNCRSFDAAMPGPGLACPRPRPGRTSFLLVPGRVRTSDAPAVGLCPPNRSPNGTP
jgi:hypothetical protein